MKTFISTLFRNRITSVVVMLVVLMTASLGQSFRELRATKSAPACGQPCSLAKPCSIAACPVCVFITPRSGICAAR
jgi:hypothetical protein